MGDRVAAVRKIAIAKRGVTPRLTRARYLAAVARARPPKPFLPDWKRGSMEGFLFPALYEFTQFTNGNELVADQLTAFRKAFARVNLSYAKSKNLTPYDVLKIASMIEKETVAPSERKLVSAVIYNRLRNKMPLGIDATLRYGLNIPGTKSLTKAAIASDNPYNSRRFPGLPPTPVANPGLASIKAAAHPAGGRLPLLRPHSRHEAALLHGERERVPAQGVRVRLRLQLDGRRRSTTCSRSDAARAIASPRA